MSGVSRSLILMPEGTPKNYVEATKGYGAEVVLYDRYNESREAIGERLAADSVFYLALYPLA